jgi:hypothetical protein
VGNTPKKEKKSKEVALDKVNEMVEEAAKNVYFDRSLAYNLLRRLETQMEKDRGNNNTVNDSTNLAASKYIETLQRSNEQLIKIAALMSKKLESTEDEEVTDKDIDQILEENTQERADAAEGKNKKDG